MTNPEDTIRMIETLPGMSRRHLLQLVGAGAGLGLIPAGALASGDPQRGGILRVSASNNPSSLDPITGRSGFDHAILYPIFDTLFEFDFDTLQVQPGLVESWEYPSPTTLVLTLREGVRFHDGTAFDAEAVKFNLDRAASYERSNVRTDIASIDSVEVNGPRTVTLTLKYPDSALELILSDRPGMMVSPAAIEAQGGNMDRTPVGTGAYSLVSWTDNSSVVVTRNPDYWKSGRPYPDGIQFSIITEMNTGLRSVIAGENDLVYSLSLQQEPVIQRSGRLNMVSGPTQIINMFYFNLARPPLDDLRVRQALNYAIDRETLNLFTQDGEATRGLLPSTHWAYNPALDDAYPYDPDRARALLAEAGMADGFELDAIGWNDQKAVQRQEIIIEQLAQVGIRIRFVTASVSDATSMFMGEKRGHLFLGAFTGRPDPSQLFSRIFDPASFLNPGGVDLAPERAELQLRTQATRDTAERQAAFYELQQVLSDHALCMPVTVQFDVTAYTDRVQGYRPNLTGKPKFDGVYLSS